MRWLDDAACRTTDTDVFFIAIWPDLDSPREYDQQMLLRARSVCRSCPVRRECGEYVMEHERGQPIRMRYGLAAGLTPIQRYRLDRRSVPLTCPNCDTLLDPLDLVRGSAECARCSWYTEPENVTAPIPSV